MTKIPIILVRGAGDLASGVAYRLHKAGLPVLMTEITQPLSVRRKVSFAEAIYAGQTRIEGITGRLATTKNIYPILAASEIPVIVDEYAAILRDPDFHFPVLIDARLTKRPPDLEQNAAILNIGLGPGFTAGENVHTVIETQRGHTLGRVYWQGTTSPDSRQPEGDPRRVLRAPVEGIFYAAAKIGEMVTTGQTIASINNSVDIKAPLDGVLRGILYSGLQVNQGLKIGDIDSRGNPDFCYQISDKALAIGGAVLEAILSHPVRKTLWD